MNANSARKTELPYFDQFKYPDLDLTPPEKLENSTEIKEDGDDEFNTSRLRFGYNKLKLHPDIFTARKTRRNLLIMSSIERVLKFLGLISMNAAKQYHPHLLECVLLIGFQMATTLEKSLTRIEMTMELNVGVFSTMMTI